ncbi:hypothetical protein Sango_3107800 [Sesamum angolense]|uniref:Uncharacterized protein n=1 Tax=Sesamum angolense TaxID=2727404 RepID=A0AAE1TA53_9LAMI|nr:hypothetical protein Sango_3107800 [Sesamum angolense]
MGGYYLGFEEVYGPHIVQAAYRALLAAIVYHIWQERLKVNSAKSQIIFSRAVQQERQQILDYLGFQEGSLPVKYLGSAGSRNAKVAWAWISKPKEEGGLGIRSLTTTNQALMLKQLWRILQNDGSWGWKKMLKLRPLLQRGVIYKIGDDSSFSLWQDAWHEVPRGPEQLTAFLGGAARVNSHFWRLFLLFSRQHCVCLVFVLQALSVYTKEKNQVPMAVFGMADGSHLASKRWRGTHLINAAFRATLAALVYHLWAERNNRKFSATSASAEYITSRVLDDIRLQILAAECPQFTNL